MTKCMNQATPLLLSPVLSPLSPPSPQLPPPLMEPPPPIPTAHIFTAISPPCNIPIYPCLLVHSIWINHHDCFLLGNYLLPHIFLLEKESTTFKVLIVLLLCQLFSYFTLICCTLSFYPISFSRPTPSSSTNLEPPFI